MNEHDDPDRSAGTPPPDGVGQPAAATTPDSEAPATEVMPAVAATAIFTPAPAAPPAAYAPGGDLRRYVAVPTVPAGPRRQNLAVVVAVAAVVVVLVVVAAAVVVRWQTTDHGTRLPATTTSSDAPSPTPTSTSARPTRLPWGDPAPSTRAPHTQRPRTERPLPTSSPRRTPRPAETKLPWSR